MRRLAVLTLCTLPVLTLAQDATTPEDDKGALTRFIENRLSGVSQEVTIDGFQGALSTRATIDRLTVSDDTGPWLLMEDLALDWDRSALLTGKVIVQELHAERITLSRRPVSDAPKTPSAEATPLRLPELPVGVYVDSLDIASIELGPDWLGEALSAQIRGAASLSGQSLDLDLSAVRTDGQRGEFAIRALHDDDNGTLSVDLDFIEGPGGIAVGMLGIPDAPAARLRVAGTGPVDDFSADVTLETNGAERITGEIGLAGSDAEQQFKIDLAGDISPMLAPQHQAFFGPDMRIRALGQRRADQALELETLLLSARALTLEGSGVIGADGWPDRFDLTGALRDADGGDVLLPLSGLETYVKGAEIDLHFDEAEGQDWVGTFTLSDLTRESLSISDAQFVTSGIIAQEDGTNTGEWTLDAAYDLAGLALSDPGVALALGAEMQGYLNLKGASGSPTVLDQFRLFGPGVELAASGDIAGSSDGYRTQAAVTLQAEDLSRLSALTGLDLSGQANVDIDTTITPLEGGITLHITGNSEALAIGQAQVDAILAGTGALDIQADRDVTGTRIPRLMIRTDHATITAQADATSRDTTADFEATIHNTTRLAPDLQGSARLIGTAKRRDGGDTMVEVSADLPSAKAQIAATLGTGQDDMPSRATITATLRNLAPYSGLFGRQMAGQADARADGTMTLGTGAFALLVEATTTDLQVDQAQVDPLITGAGKLHAEVTRDAVGRLTVSGFDLSTGNLTATGQGTLDNRRAQAQFDAQVPDAGRVIPGLSGALNLTGRARQSDTGGTDATINATAPDTEVTLRATVSPTTDSPTRFALDAHLRDLSRFADAAGQPLRGRATLQGHGAVNSVGAIGINLTGQTQDLALGQPALDPILAGMGSLTADAARAENGDLTLNGAQLTTRLLRASAKGSMTDGQPEGSVTAFLRDLSQIAPGVTGTAQLDGSATANPDGSSTIALTLDAPETSARLDAVMQSPAKARRTAFTLTARADQLSQWQGLVGMPVRGAVDLSAEGTARPKAGTVDATLNFGSDALGVGVELVDRILAGRGRGSATIRRLRSGLVQVKQAQITWPNFSASAEADAQSDGQLATRFSARLPQSGLLAPQLSGPITAEGRARILGDKSHVDVTLQGAGELRAQMSGTIVGSGRMDMGVTGTVPFALFNADMAPMAMSGVGAVDLRIKGAPELGALSGKISTQGARLSIPRFSTALSDIEGSLQLTGGQAIADLRAAVPRGGRMTLSGPLQLTGRWPADLTLRADDVVLRDPQLYDTRADADLRLRGQLRDGATISGLVTLDRTEIRIPSSSVASLGPLPEVRHIGAPGTVRRTLKNAGLSVAGIDLRRGGNAETGSGAREQRDFALDVTVSAPSRIFVRGRGLDAELGGKIHLGGEIDQIIPSGRFSLVRGRFNILQQRFELDEGYATLEGDFTPYIYLLARTQRNDVTTMITLDGRLSAPDISFSSMPELPEDEVLAQLIFGRDLESITPFQAVQLAAAVNTLAGRGGVGIVGRLRENLALDDLDITTTDEGNTALRAGKYLTEDLYSDVVVDSTGKSQINLNLDVSPDLTMRGSTDSDGESSIGLFFEKDY